MDKLGRDLDVLAQIAPNCTLNIKTMTPIKHHSWIGATKRLLFRENRDKTITTIEEIVDMAISNLPRDIDLLFRLKRARSGLVHLKETYSDDDTIKTRLDSCLTRLDNVTTRFERRLITSIEEIPDLLSRELVTSANEHEYDNLVLVRQTPITSQGTSQPASQPNSKNETPTRTPIDARTPIDQRTPLRTPTETPPPTPPSTPTRHSSPPRVEETEIASDVSKSSTSSKHFLFRPRRNLGSVFRPDFQTTTDPQRGGNPGPQRGGNPGPQRGGNPGPQRGGNSSSNQSHGHYLPHGLMRPTLSQQLQVGMFPWKSVQSIGWGGYPVVGHLDKNPSPPAWFKPNQGYSQESIAIAAGVPLELLERQISQKSQKSQMSQESSDFPILDID
jgi:hypothetical protein